MSERTPFENNFDDLLHKPTSNTISETLSNVDVSNPFRDVISPLIAPTSSSSDQDVDDLLGRSFFTSNEEKSEEKEHEVGDVLFARGMESSFSIPSESQFHERISNSDESSFEEERIIIGDSHEKPRLTNSELNFDQSDFQDGDMPLFQITVEDPQKIGDPINAHIIYKVRTRTTSNSFKSRDFTVLRRYRDFLWLYNQLTNGNPGVIVPPVPGKHAIGRFQDEFVESRRQALERCLNKITTHPMLYKDPNLMMFLESDRFVIDVKRKNKGESKGVLKSLGEVVSNATTFNKFVETDEWFENRKNQLDILDSQLKTLMKSVEAIVRQRKDLGFATAEFGDNLLSLANAENNKSLARNLTLLGNLQQKIKELQEKQVQQDVATLENTIDEYIRLIGSIKVAFNSREKVYQAWQNAIYELQKKKINYERSKVQGRLSHDKLSIALAQIAESENRAEECKGEFEEVSKLIKVEIDRFDKEKVEDFKNSVEAFLESLMETQKEVISLWESYFLQIESQPDVAPEDGAITTTS
ncbi:11502_t:CDS:10 [Acaulospora colombiana]|uniref:11502_t:CDS:1 n=1 Tax=Acaulospora colombiana TaxID=27376 RepID=A0ACA9L231_9GLOM|nr:11502_t:CDS:10 [Acaulospora colombiana]